MRIGWKVNESVHLNFTAKNIFNKEYMMRPGDVQPPRTFLIQLSVKV
jgi:outer membrane receptor protein involved in Fe transport